MPKRFQFSLRTLLIAMLCAAFFFGGLAWQRKQAAQREMELTEKNDALFAELQKRLNQPTSRFGKIPHQGQGGVFGEIIRLPDGSEWSTTWKRISPANGTTPARPFTEPAPRPLPIGGVQSPATQE